MKIGDRVRISDAAAPQFREQADGNLGTIISHTGTAVYWVLVKFDHGYRNNYPLSALINANEHQPMLEGLDITLDEIESYQEIYRKLEERKVNV